MMSYNKTIYSNQDKVIPHEKNTTIHTAIINRFYVRL